MRLAPPRAAGIHRSLEGDNARVDIELKDGQEALGA